MPEKSSEFPCSACGQPAYAGHLSSCPIAHPELAQKTSDREQNNSENQIERAEKGIENLNKHIRETLELLKNPELSDQAKHAILDSLARAYNRIDIIGDKEKKEFMPPQVFISYSHKNEGLAQGLVKGFQSQGVRYWIDVEKIASNTVEKQQSVQQRTEEMHPDDSHPIGAFPNEIQVKGIPDSSHMVVLLTRGAMDRFEQVKIEIVSAEKENGSTYNRYYQAAPSDYGCGIIPVIVGDKEDQKYIENQLNKDEEVSFLLRRQPIFLPSDTETNGEKLASMVLSEIRKREPSRDLNWPYNREYMFSEGGGKRNRTKDLQRGYDKKNPIKPYYSKEREVVNPIIQKTQRSLDYLNESTQNLGASPESEEVFKKMAETKKIIDNGLENYFREFKPESVTLADSDSPLIKELRDNLEKQGIGIDYRSSTTSSYGVFVLTKDMLGKPLPPDLKAQMKKAMKDAGDDPTQFDIVPVYVGIENFDLIRQRLQKEGLDDFVNYIGLTADQNHTSGEISAAVLEFIRRSERSRKAPGMYRMNYNRPLNQTVTEHLPETARMQVVKPSRRY